MIPETRGLVQHVGYPQASTENRQSGEENIYLIVTCNKAVPCSL